MIIRLTTLAILAGLLALCLASGGPNVQAFSYPTPSSSPSPFSGVTTQPTPGPTLPQLLLCFSDQGGSVSCGQNLSVAAGDYVTTGISVGLPATDGTPQGPFPSTITLTVNGHTYSSVPVGVNGLVGYATLSGLQQISVTASAAGYVSGVQTVVTH